MAVSLRDARPAATDREWIRSIYPEYLEELAELSHAGTGVFPIHGEHGAREACDFVKQVDFKPSEVAFDAAFDK